MKTTNRLYEAITCLLLAFLIYFLFRPTNLLLYKWIGIEDCINAVSNSIHLKIEMPQWIIFNLPDGLWLLSFYFFMDSLWDHNKIKYMFDLVLFAVSILSEFLQYANIILGRGDYLDVLFYLLASILYYLINKRKAL